MIPHISNMILGLVNYCGDGVTQNKCRVNRLDAPGIKSMQANRRAPQTEGGLS